MFRLVLIVGLAGLACGRNVPHLDGRIVGGRPAEIEDYPYQLSFERFNIHDCGASLITSNVVVTAAHCTGNQKANQISLRAGSSLVHRDGQVAGVLDICDHPKFNGAVYDYDVSVLLLNQSFTLGPGVQTIPLALLNSEVPTGHNASVSGWGRLQSGGQLPEKLQVVEVPKVEQSQCVDMYAQYNKTVTDRMTCYGYTEGRKDSCQGDSGGPLVIDGMLIGVVSWGRGCASPRLPGVYAKISHPEIQNHINNCLAKFK